MSRCIALLLVLFALTSCVNPASAQTGYGIIYVSGTTGSDSNNCYAPTSSCLTLNAAITKTAAGGTILCLDPPYGYNTLTVSISVTIHCNATYYASFTINVPSSDPKQTVHLIGMTFNDIGYTNSAILINSAGTVILQDMIIEGTSVAAVKDVRTTAGKLEIKNTVISKNTGIGVLVAGASSNFAVLDNVTLDTSTYGIAVASGNRVNITRSTISNNSVAGVEADGGSLVIVDGSTITNNNVGVQSGSAVRLSNDNITFNTTGVSGATGTYGNNRFAGNTSDGTALTPVGASSTDLAQK